MDYNNYFPSNLGFLIKKNGLSRKEFGDVIDKTSGVIGFYIRGDSIPSLEVIINTARFFNISLDQLVRIDLTIEDNYSQKVLGSNVEKQLNSMENKITYMYKTMSKQLTIKQLQKLEKEIDKEEKSNSL